MSPASAIPVKERRSTGTDWVLANYHSLYSAETAITKGISIDILSVTIIEHECEGFRVYDARVWDTINGRTDFKEIGQLTHNEISDLGNRVGWRCVSVVRCGILDSMLAIRDAEWVYSPEFFELPSPVAELELSDIFIERKLLMAKKANQTVWLARWFVTRILEREWTNDDYRGMHMKHAKQVLGDFELADICGTLEACKDGLLGEVNPTYITIIRTFEPSLLNQYREYKRNAPPVYLESATAEWEERVSRVYGPETQSELSEIAQA